MLTVWKQGWNMQYKSGKREKIMPEGKEKKKKKR